MKKRLKLCLFLALLLSLSSPARALAAQGGSSTELTAEPYLPDIKIEVVVPATGNVYINPYQLPIEVDGKIENKQVISDTFGLENQSEVPLQVDVEVTGTIKPGSTMGLLSTSTKKVTTTMKRAFMYFEIHTASDPTAVEWDSKYSSSKHIVVRESSQSKKNIIRLDACDNEKRFGAFRLSGDCVQKPREPWSSEDGVDVEVVFTFTPLPLGTPIP